MQIKVVQPEPKWYRISYAMLKNVIKKSNVRRASAVSAVASKLPKDKFGDAVLLALNKHLIDEDDIEIKLLELQTMSNDEFDNYVQELRQADNIHATNAAETETNTSNMTEAEIMLAKVKNGGAVIGDFSNMDNVQSMPNGFGGSEQRSLSEIQEERKLDLQAGYATLNQNSTKTSIDDCAAAVQQMRQTIASQQPKQHKQPNNSMSNLKGLKTPIVQPPHQTSMTDLFADFKWSLGPR